MVSTQKVPSSSKVAAPEFKGAENWERWVGGNYRWSVLGLKVSAALLIGAAAWNMDRILSDAGRLRFLWFAAAMLLLSATFTLDRMHAKLRDLWQSEAESDADRWLEKAVEHMEDLSPREQRLAIDQWRARQGVARNEIREGLARRYNRWWIRLFGLRPSAMPDKFRVLTAQDFVTREHLAEGAGDPALAQLLLEWKAYGKLAELTPDALR